MRQLKTSLLSGKTIYKNRVLFLILFGFSGLFWGCGKKAPPVAPQAVVPPAVGDLTAEVIGDSVRLMWSVPQKDNTAFSGLEYFAVYRYGSDSPDKVCEGCPIPFSHLVDIQLDNPRPARIEQGRVVMYDKIEAGYAYAYKVVSYHESGGMSGYSNIVRVHIKE